MNDFEVKSYLGDYPFFGDTSFFPIAIDGVIYMEKDAHIFIANGKVVNLPIPSGTLPTFVAVNGEDVTPTTLTTRIIEVREIGEDGEETTNSQEIQAVSIPAKNGDKIHAIFDWDNLSDTNQDWFSDILQFGLNSETRKRNQLTNGRDAFYNMTANPAVISDLDTSNLTNMNNMFRKTSSFNQNISEWNTSNVTEMYSMFSSASSFNQPLSKWDTSNVKNMKLMFYNTPFNQGISEWNTSNVTNMDNMFKNASKFNQDLSLWCVSQFSAKPSEFDSGATAWKEARPVWGTCPGGENTVLR